MVLLSVKYCKNDKYNNRVFIVNQDNKDNLDFKELVRLHTSITNKYPESKVCIYYNQENQFIMITTKDYNNVLKVPKKGFIYNINVKFRVIQKRNQTYVNAELCSAKLIKEATKQGVVEEF